MNDFITGLYNALIQEIQIPAGDPEYQRAIQAYTELEEQVKEKTGLDLLSRYQCARHQAYRWEDIAIFASGLRFGAQFALTAIAPQSSQTSIP